MKKVLFLAYHNSQNKNIQSTALVRRIEQYEVYFLERGYKIDYITIKNDSLDVSSWRNRTLEIPLEKYRDNKYLNKINTFFIMLRWGDHIGYSFYKNRKEILAFLANDYDLVISFFTPRGTIWLGSYLKKRLKIKWWVDLQDSLVEGLNNQNMTIGLAWLKKHLALADEIIHVSPEWSDEDSKRINKEIRAFRHCIPDTIDSNNSFKFPNSQGSKKKILYAGNIHFYAMEPELLSKSLHQFRKQLNFYFAGETITSDKLKKMSLPTVDLGYLKNVELHKAYQESDVIVIFAWSKIGRYVIPSKFYEACAFRKPILIVGKDSGAFQKLFKEWGHPNVINDTEEKVLNTIRNYLIGKNDGLFYLENCTFPVSDLKGFYKFLDNLLSKEI